MIFWNNPPLTNDHLDGSTSSRKKKKAGKRKTETGREKKEGKKRGRRKGRKKGEKEARREKRLPRRRKMAKRKTDHQSLKIQRML